MCQPCSRPFPVNGSHSRLVERFFSSSPSFFTFTDTGGGVSVDPAGGLYLAVKTRRSVGERVMTNVRPATPTFGTGVAFNWEMLAWGRLVNTE